MEENKPTPNDEISLRDLILKIKSYIHEVLRFWLIPAICIVLVLGYEIYKYITYVPVYPATITFSVDEDEGGSAAGLTGILGQFGLGAVRPSRFNLDKILALSKSRRVVENTLFAKIVIDGKEDFLANHLIRLYDLNKKKNKKASPSSGSYFSHDSLPAFNLDENEMLLKLYSFIIGSPDNPKNALVRADYNEDTNILTLGATTTNETLSLELADRLFKSLSDYYINKAIEKQLKTFTIVSAKRDSVLAELKSVEYQLASFKDSHRGLLMKTDQLSELRLQREITALAAIYAEVLKNTEIADFSLKNKTPFIQVIDAPLPPIPPAQLSLLRKILLSVITGGGLGSLYVVGRKIFRELMAA